MHPRDLLGRARINFRQGSRGVYRWESEKGRQSLAVVVDGPLVVDHAEIHVRAAVDGVYCGCSALMLLLAVATVASMLARSSSAFLLSFAASGLRFATAPGFRSCPRKVT